MINRLSLAATAERLGCGVLVLDDDEQLAVAPADRVVHVARVDLLGERTATVVLIEREPGAHELDAAALESVAIAAEAELLREQASEERHARLADGLHALLLFEDGAAEPRIGEHAAQLGIDLTGGNAVVAVLGGTRRSVRRAARHSEDPPAALFEHSGAVLCLLTRCETDHAPRRLASALERELEGSRIVFAGPHRGVAGARRALSECRQALRAASGTAWSGRPAGFDELGIWTILASADREGLIRFRDSVLGPVIAYDQRRQAQLTETLRELVRSGFNWRLASSSLAVHPNTVRYRMTVIAKLTGLDLGVYDDQVKADIALRIADLLVA